MILRKAHAGKEGPKPSSHITLAPERCDSGVILLIAVGLFELAAFNVAAHAKDDWEKYDGPSQPQHVTPWKSQADKAKTEDKNRAQCRAVAPLVADHTGKSTDAAMAECMKRRQVEKP